MRFHVCRKVLNRKLGIYRNRKCKVSSLIILLLGISFSLVTLHYLIEWNIICFNLELERHLNHLCINYRNGKAFGNLCKPLCDDGKVGVMSCEPFHKGKVFVATATWNGLKVVIKSYKSKPDEYISLESNSSAEISTEEFKEMISQSLQVNFGETEYMSIHSLFPFLGNYDDLNNGTTMSKELMHNLYQLSQDNEYITLMLNRNSNHFPKVLGFCGHFYAVEYAQPLTQFLRKTSQPEGVLRFRIAKWLLDLVSQFENKSKQIHMCDVKLEHFGVLNDKSSTPRLVLLDADTVFTRAILDRSISDGRSCHHSSDCDFFDCHSLCNRDLKICDTSVLNNNLQLICKKIFIDSGLLISSSSHLNNLIPDYQQVLLKQCADPYSSGGRQSAPIQLLDELDAFLSQYLLMTEV